jgi:predicted component of type VI protein secretion system
MPAQLLALTDGPSLVLDKPILLLGRHPECDIQIDSRKVSRRHCCIAQVADYLVVRDLDSTNGIRINGVRVQEGKLHHGDELTIGNHRYQVCWDGLPPPRPSLLKKESARSGERGPPADDEALEGCDEPVPLAEPRGARKGEFPPVSQPLRPAPPPPSPSPEPLILPDDIQLAPGSDANLGPAAQSSHSHH